MPISCILIEQSFAENTNSQTGIDVCLCVSNSVFHSRLGPSYLTLLHVGLLKLAPTVIASWVAVAQQKINHSKKN